MGYGAHMVTLSLAAIVNVNGSKDVVIVLEGAHCDSFRIEIFHPGDPSMRSYVHLRV